MSRLASALAIIGLVFMCQQLASVLAAPNSANGAICVCTNCSSLDCFFDSPDCVSFDGSLDYCDDVNGTSCVDLPCDFPADNCTEICELRGCEAEFISCPPQPSTEDDNKGVCFPADATVMLKDGSEKTMADLSIGDEVMVAPGQFSPVYFFSHRLADVKALFVRIVTDSNHTLMLTPTHYLYVNRRLTSAGSVQVGDSVEVAEGRKAKVIKVSTKWDEGLYNPHTMTGDLYVNGVRTSTYTTSINPTLAHAALWPVRMLYTFGVDIFGDTFDAGSEWFAILPNGDKTYPDYK